MISEVYDGGWERNGEIESDQNYADRRARTRRDVRVYSTRGSGPKTTPRPHPFIMRWIALGRQPRSDDPPLVKASDLLEHFADVSLKEMLTRQSNALVKGVLHPGETCMIYGDSTAGKTFVGIDLGWHIALGRDWHGRRAKRAPVLYCALEGVEGFKKRMLAAGKEHGDPGKWFARATSCT